MALTIDYLKVIISDDWKGLQVKFSPFSDLDKTQTIGKRGVADIIQMPKLLFKSILPKKRSLRT